MPYECFSPLFPSGLVLLFTFYVVHPPASVAVYLLGTFRLATCFLLFALDFINEPISV